MTPDAYTNQELFLEVGHGHELYVHDWGNKGAKQVIFYVHGGPGSASRNRHKQQFDPTLQRVIFHDQRGAGRSLPYGSIDHNTTQDLIADISKIADKLHIKHFILRGGSWGACLALAYALKHPEKVEALVLDSIFTGSQDEIDWLGQGLFQTFFPDAWEAYIERTPKSHHLNPTAYHYKRVLTGSEQAQRESAYALSCLEGAILRLDDRFTPEDPETFDPAGMRIEAHYLSNKCFLADRHILTNIHKLIMPIYVVQGRYDMVCPPSAAYELSLRAPDARLLFTTSGHAAERESFTAIKLILTELLRR